MYGPILRRPQIAHSPLWPVEDRQLDRVRSEMISASSTSGRERFLAEQSG
jgi:hypothetical protein